MAHIYHGSDDLILTDIQKEDFPSGLSRIDATYKCRTTKADNLAPLLAAGNRMPEYPAYIIRQNPTRVAGQDGFTTFTSSSYSGTIGISNATPAVFGAQVQNVTFTLNRYSITNFGNGTSIREGPRTESASFKILSDTITRKFVLFANVSITTLAIPQETISYKTLNSSLGPTVDAASFLQSAGGTYPINVPAVFSNKSIINVNRQTYGGVDEVQVTWGLEFLQTAFDIYNIYSS